MSDGIKAFWLGVFIVITLAVAAWLLLFLRPSVGDGGKVLKVRFSNIQNVSIGTRVTFGGKAVGSVVKIEEIDEARTLPPDDAGNLYFYQLDLRVDSSVKIYNYDEIVFSTAGLLGEKSIAIIPKSGPPGSPPPYEITDEILYARSTDTLQEMLTQLNDVATLFEGTMQQVSTFLTENTEQFHQTLVAVDGAADAVSTFLNGAVAVDFTGRAAAAADALATTMNRADLFLKEVQNNHLIPRVAAAADQVKSSLARVVSNEGTLGQLINSDTLYVQMSAMMTKLDLVASDINHYGLLFQFDKSWQRKRLAQENAAAKLCTPSQVLYFFNTQMGDIADRLDRLERLLYRIGSCPQDPCINQAFQELRGRLESLLLNLQNCNMMNPGY